MSRDSNGNYTLPTGNPVITDTVIDSVWANDTMNDLAATMTASLDRDGKGSMRAPLRTPDGNRTTPTFSFTLEPSSGLYRFGDGDVRVSVLNSDVLRLTENIDLRFFGTADLIMTDGVVRLNNTDFQITGGVYSFDATGLVTSGGALYIGALIDNEKVLTNQNITAAEIPFDNAVVGVLPATNVQTAIDQLTAGSANNYGSVSWAGGGTLLAGSLNILTDSSTFFLPPASSTQVGTVIGIALPSTYNGQTPLVQRSGADIITWEQGNDTELLFQSPATIQLTSNGVDTWEY